MLDIKFIRENTDLVKSSIQKRGTKFDVDQLVDLDEERRKILLKADDLRRQKNEANDEITRLLKEKKPVRRKRSHHCPSGADTPGGVRAVSHVPVKHDLDILAEVRT